jgi:predicted small lipoprotein YifL
MVGYPEGASDHGDEPRTPLWVKVFGGLTVLVLLLFVFLQLAGSGEHGPGRHLPADEPEGQTSLSTGWTVDAAAEEGRA